MKYILPFLSFVFLLSLGVSGQEAIASCRGTIDGSTRLSEPIQFSISEASIIRVRVEASGFGPVVCFYPENGRGFEWDSGDTGLLIHSDFFDLPMKYTVRVRASDQADLSSANFSITIAIIEPRMIFLGKPVSGSYSETGAKEVDSIVEWYILNAAKPGVFTATLQGDEFTKMIIIRGWDFYKDFTHPDSYHAAGSDFSIAEPGIYAVRISFFERTQGGYTFTISEKK